MGHFEGFNLRMSKCHVRELSKVYEAIFRDALYAYPTLGVEFERDLVRLKRLVKQRGIRVYLVDLPAVGKHLDRCLDNGQYSPSGLALTKGFRGGVVIPKFLRGLYLLVFDDSGRLKDDADVQAVFFLRQILSVAKKATIACDADKVEDEVLEFVDVDNQLPEPERFWDEVAATQQCIRETYHGFGKSHVYASRADALAPHKRSQLSSVLAKLDLVSGFVATSLGSYDPSHWLFRHGPGAVSEWTGPANKYCWQNWSDTLEREFPIADYGFHSFSSWADRSHHEGSFGSSREPNSRMVAVPKSYTKPRLIAAEPCANQWCQQNLWHYFSDRTAATWLHKFVRFRDQTYNQGLCSVGASDGTLATVDLSAASDRVSCHFVGQMFRSNPRLLLALQSTRTRLIEQKLTPKAPAMIKLKKFSTMGNACTFPVESLGFLSIALACVLETRKLSVTLRNLEDLAGEVAVFGDDIVIPSDSRELFVLTLEVLHFKVNISKSFWTGRFRESCGVDSFRGVDVTPAYWKCSYDGKPESLDSTVQAANNFYKKWLLNVSTLLSSQLPRLVPQVAMHSGVLGLKSRTDPVLDGLRVRWNSDLQRDELFALTTSSSQEKAPIEDDSALLQYFTEAPEPHTKWKSGIPQRPRRRMRPRWVAMSDLTSSM